MPDHHQLVTEQYNPVAGNYLTSTVHASGQDLHDLTQALAASPHAHVLDLGCGGGHVSYALSPQVSQVTAYDLSGAMLDVVRQSAQARGFSNILTRQGAAEQLPFADASFDWVVTRFSAHHWSCIRTVAQEIRRVLKPTGQLVVIDTVTPQHALLTTWLQSVELLRDTSHVRNRTLAEWRAVLEEQGMHLDTQRQWRLPLEFASWVGRMRTPPERIEAIHSLWAVAPQEVKDYFEVREDGSFSIDVAWLQGTLR